MDSELSRVVWEADKQIMPGDCKRINTRRVLSLKNKPTCRPSDGLTETVSKVEGSSMLDKGKGVDPHNWGALSKVNKGLDLDGQKAELES